MAAYEFGYIVPDPSNPNMIYAGGPGRGLVLMNRANRQVQTISPNVSRDGDFRMAQNPPLAFSPQDPHMFYEGTQFLMETQDAGTTWKKISPDLTDPRRQRRGESEGEGRKLHRTRSRTRSCGRRRRTRRWPAESERDQYLLAVAGGEGRDLGRHHQRPDSANQR